MSKCPSTIPPFGLQAIDTGNNISTVSRTEEQSVHSSTTWSHVPAVDTLTDNTNRASIFKVCSNCETDCLQSTAHSTAASPIIPVEISRDLPPSRVHHWRIYRPAKVLHEAYPGHAVRKTPTIWSPPSPLSIHIHVRATMRSVEISLYIPKARYTPKGVEGGRKRERRNKEGRTKKMNRIN